MKKYGFLFLLLIPLLGQAKCTPKGTTSATQPITLDLTTGSTTVNFNPNLQGSFDCNTTGDKMYYATSLQDYIVEIKDSASSQSIFIKLTLESSDFPVNTGSDRIASVKNYSVDDTLNNKQMTLKASYVAAMSYSSDNGEKVYGNSFSLSKPAVNFLSNNSCNSNILAWIVCSALRLFSNDNAYSQYLTFTVKHKPTTCRFSQPTYEIKMPDTTLNEILSGNNSKTGSTNLVLNCDGVYNVTTNPVSFNVARGDWNDNGTILKNTIINGAQGVGFQIYNGTAATPLKRGDALMSRLTKMATINDQYTFPITARYVRITGEALQPGEVQSKVIFAVSYD
ncbi:fimbrial protein [Salmonella enterica]|nr:fimbrial protein [Salmonella enterica]EHN2141919.1 type 1 fimbrial protein [Salmonella enterica subsp. diarizonae serovar 61:l,v:z35]EHQ9197522.1 type 1 fimbrial protein [Salmonella enterica subsp. diarizonae serovar 50:k:z:[z50],[z57],[z68], [z86]]EKR1689508.1 type 1 fimbrial protein [Salmonella enterica subsp. diarizonae serovar 6,7,14:k:z50]EKR1871489.1 type 1 fimbrial protein [Salmonella enterica subsp. diarizonae serovar 11:k:z53]HCA3616836.1 type 1 fimbrial protein [Salmonella enteric